MNELQILDKNLKGVRKSPLYLDEIVRHDKLFEAYPTLRDVKVRFESNTGNKEGSYHPEENEFVLRTGLKLEPEKLKNTLIHEIQHAIQEQEGFSRGTNPGYWDEMIQSGYSRRKNDGRIERASKEYHRIFDSAPEEFKDKVRRINRARLDGDYDAAETVVDELYDSEYADLWSQLDMAEFEWRSDRGEELNAYDLYRDTAGEIEARDAAARRGLTAEERRGRKPDTGDENTVFADGGESYSIANTRDMPWKDQVRGYFSNDGTIKSSDSLYLGESSVEGVDNAPMYIPTSVITKAIRPPKGSRSAHALSQKNILNLQEGIKNAPVVIDNPARNSIVYVTADQDSAENYIIAALDKSNDLYGETAHKVTSIHGRENIAAMLEKLGDDATIFVKNENKLNRMLPGNQILKSLALRAKVELDGESISGRGGNVKSPTLGDEIRRQIMGEENEATVPLRNVEKQYPEPVARADDLADASVSQHNGDVKPKTRYSVEDETDSAGRELTVQQQEYFKDSKVRDEDGRLKVMYHGTNADKPFTVFDTYGGKFGLFGRGSYFTDDPEVAHSYTAKGKGKAPRTYEVYLDIKNPLDMDAAFDRSAWTDQPTDIRDAIAGATTNEDVFRALKQYCEDEGMIRWEAEDFISDTVRSAGFDGITHVGGGRYGSKDGQKHRVFIAFDPEQIKRVDNKTPTDDPDIRFSAEDEGDEWNRELERMPGSVQEAVQRVKGSRGGSMREFPNLDAYLSDKGARLAEEKAERLRNRGKDEFDGTKALEKLGVKIENSAGDYSVVDQLIANDQAAKTIQRETRKAIKRLSATPKEQNFALNIASGLYDEEDIPATMNRGKVMQLADYYSAEKSMSTDLIKERRREIGERLHEKMKDLFDERFEGEFTTQKRGKGIAPESGLALYHRTPQRSMRAIFGWDRGQKINEAIFEPVYVNEQERKRFINRLFDEARTFEGADGEKSALNKDESAFAQKLKEGRTVEELVEKSGVAENIRAAAENLKNGAEMKDAAREFNLDEGSRNLTRQYADWLQTQEDYAAAENIDRTKIENAIEKYTELYDKLYAAINDFLVAHGYEPIGFIKGYAPHFQPEAENGKLESALKAIGVDLGSGVGKLPTSIAGLTKSFKPNKRYNPFFQHRRGSETDYDIVKGFETYVDYASDVLYHTDDIMRVRAAAKYFRRKYAPDDISALIEQAEDLKFATPEEKELFLKTNGIVDDDVKLSYQAMNRAMEQYTEDLFNDVTQTTKYGDLVTWLDDYGNKLAGKQLFNDRSMEREVGREALNGAKKLNRMFARANVAGNLSSALNQTAQLPMIATELGQKNTWRAVGDILRGKTTGMSAFRGESDFLTEKSGIDYIQSTKGEKALKVLFSPLEKVDTLVSTIAVRGKYRMELDAGKSPKEAMKAADRWARDIMGTRSKGSVPLTFQSKNLIAQMMNMFQVEAANTFEHVTQDRLGPGFKEMAAKIGKDKAIKKLASDAIAYMLLAFLLNRLDEELYGGTPAPFDVLGMGLNAVASGNGLTSSDLLKTIMDNVTESFFGERLFDTDPDAMNDEFDGWAAAEDTMYNISNDVPYARNVAGLMGWGDQTLPMPDLYGAAKGIGGAFADAAEGDMRSFSEEIARQLMGLAGDTLPGGRQAEKTAQGIEAVARGGSYKGSGDSKRLQYPVNSPLEDPWTALRAAIFGKNALPESRTYWAAGGKALSAAQTRLYEDLVDSGLSRKRAYEILKRFNDATADLEADRDKNGNPIGGSKKEKIVTEINKLPLSRKQKNMLYLSRGYSEKDLNSLPWN